MPDRNLSSPTVDIALATYNGAAYLGPFLRSLREQNHSDWRLVYRDDASSDNTVDLLDACMADGIRVIRVVDGMGNVRVVRNFSLVLEHCSAEYIMLADQDDYWYPSKIQESLEALRALEAGTPGMPALVFSDLHVCDSDLKVLHPSYIDHQGLNKLRQPTLTRLLTQNVAPGCSMIFNRALLKAALPIPESALMHDWWLILVAAASGRIAHCPRPLLAYRQHGHNQVGARSPLASVLVRLREGPGHYRRAISAARAQAMSLRDRLGSKLSAPDARQIEAFGTLHKYPFIFRQLVAWRHGLHKSGATRDLAFYLLM